ncbi:PREDICTED: G-type lectin S-receptor serine/threonine-kinase, partial [Prunus dulcis]
MLNLSLVCLISFFTFFSFSYPATDTFTSLDTLGDNQTLVSSGGLFELGFFSENFRAITIWEFGSQQIEARPHALCADSAGGNSGRCLTSIPFKCGDGKFYERNGSLPSTFSGTGFISTGTTECETLCKSNCSCTAFAALLNEQPPGCQLYFGSKHDLLKIIEKGAGIVYIRGRAPS